MMTDDDLDDDTTHDEHDHRGHDATTTATTAPAISRDTFMESPLLPLPGVVSHNIFYRNDHDITIT